MNQADTPTKYVTSYDLCVAYPQVLVLLSKHESSNITNMFRMLPYCMCLL